MVAEALVKRAQTDATAALRAAGHCEIHRYMETRNAWGDVVKSWSPIASRLPCKVTEPTALASNRERERVGAIAQVGQWVLVLPWDASVTSRDRIYVTSPLPVRTFDVTMVLGPHAGQIRLPVVCDEVT